MAAGAGALGTQTLVGHHGDRVVEDLLHPGFEQQRDLHHRGGRVAHRRSEGGHALTHQRPQQTLEPLAPSVGAERLGGQQAAIHRAVAHGVREAGGHLLANGV